MSTTPEFDAEQLAVARAKVWRQDGDALLTLDAARDWLRSSGLVLFSPRAQQLPVPAPSLVEAMLGAPSGGPTTAQIETARNLIARLVAEGNALPLNLLGTASAGAGDTPDFVVSAQIFSYIFTLRGDKSWKLPPPTGSPLSLRIFEVLTKNGTGEKGALSASELASELGRELTEAAVLRALHELWSSLRVLPLIQPGDAPTVWELTSRRFTKAIKAGVNAGQPTALSALLSLYLAQVLMATEEEIETFLSPLTARSRIRDVVHALSASRQIETIVLDGKSLLYVPGTLPEFPAIANTEHSATMTKENELVVAPTDPDIEGEGRIRKFTGTKFSGAKFGGSSPELKKRGDFKGKPARSLGMEIRPSVRRKTGSSDAARPSRPFAPRFAGKSSRPATARPDRERRPFRRDAAENTGEKPTYRKPWNEDRKPATRKPFMPRGEGDSGASRRTYVRREGATPSAGFAKRPYTPRREGDSGVSKRPYVRHEGAAPSAGFAKRTYTPREGDRTPPQRPYKSRESGSGDYPKRGASGAKRPFAGAPPARDSFAKFRKPEREERKPHHTADEQPTYGGSDSQPRAPKRPFPRKEGDLADRPIRPWVEQSDRKAQIDRKSQPGRKTWEVRAGQSGGFANKSSDFGKKFGGFGKKTGGFGKKPGGFSGHPGRPAPFGGKSGFAKKLDFGKRPSGVGGFKPVGRRPKPTSDGKPPEE